MACSHGEPFEPVDQAQDGPFSSTPPVRLTFASIARSPAWNAAGDSVLYSWRPLDRADGDRCIAWLPATGGTIGQQYCPAGDVRQDTTTVFDLPALAASGGLALRRVVQARASGTAFEGLFAVENGGFQSLMAVPQLVGSTLYQSVDMLRWWGPSSLVVLGYADELFECVDAFGASCDRLIRHPHAVLKLAPGAPATEVPGTEFATSAAPGADDGELLLSFAADSRIYRLQAPASATAIYDFGAGRIVRDLTYAAGRAVGVVAGHVLVADDDIGPLQDDDRGGELWLVDLAGSAATRISPDGMLFRHPRLAPDARAVVAEGYPFTLLTVGAGVFDSVPAGPVSLYRFDLP